jgi:hypothetical protein
VFQPKPSSIDAVAPACAPSTPFAHKGGASAIAQRNLKIVDRGHPARKRVPAERSNTEPREELLVERILQAFNTWSFKREQPDNLVSLRQAIGRAVHLKEPVPFVLYWGKGPRRAAGKPEEASLDYLSALVDRIRHVYDPGAAIRLICTDTHANLNGHSPQAIKDYFGSIRVQAQARGFTDCRLTDLVRALQNTDGSEAVDTPYPDPMTLQRLSECAAKWYRGEGSASEGASEYFRMNMVEKRAVELAFPNAIFITFNGSEFRCLFPDRMPIFYMYSLKRGVSAKPWFLPDEM